MVTKDEKWVTYYNIVRKQSWSKCGEVAQTVAKPGLTASLTRGHAARWLFRVTLCHKGAIDLQITMPSPGFEPKPYGTAGSVTNHYTGWTGA
ncbi:hypothetical protein TNCV_2298651 [Trichonephila clavipes]|nr:hypothetical protein TNCV_2298651 [Trichonephila clavipes]